MWSNPTKRQPRPILYNYQSNSFFLSESTIYYEFLRVSLSFIY